MDEHPMDEHPDELLDGVIAGGLSPAEQAQLDGHLATCAACEVALDSLRAWTASTVRSPQDAARDAAAVDGALARLTLDGPSEAAWPEDEALNLAAVESVMARLGRPAPVRWLPRPGRRVPVALGAAAVAAVAVVAVFSPRLTAPPMTTPLATGPLATAPAATQKVPSTTAHAPAPLMPPVFPVLLADGSEITPDDAATPVHVGEQTATRTTVHLPSGGARFKVRHDSRRVFRVKAGPVEIEDLGTVFRVAHEPGGGIRVAVSEGRVAVLIAGRRLRGELVAGDNRVFPTTDEPPAIPTTPAAVRDVVTVAPATPVAPTRGVAVRGPAGGRFADDPAGLLQAADVARRSRHPRAAVAPLRRLIEHYPRDPRAPSAAFTLGWVLLTELNRPREAALAFTEAERIAPRGALAEDAAARIAEAWHKAGEGRLAAEAARRYEQGYPSGRYLSLMRGLIGAR